MLDHKFVIKWVESAMYVADSVLGLTSLYDSTYVSDENVPCDFYTQVFKNGCTMLVANEAMIKPWDLQKLFQSTKVEKFLNNTDFGSILAICFGVFHEMRHIYQKDIIEASRGGKYAPRIGVSPETCAIWTNNLKKYPSLDNIDSHNVINQDARLFAGYLVSRFLLENEFFGGDEYKPYREKYDSIPLPTDEDILKVANYMIAKKSTSPFDAIHSSVPIVRQCRKIGRNDPCPCGSGLKYKNCCGKYAQ